PWDGDVRSLSQNPPIKRERPEHEDPDSTPTRAPGSPAPGTPEPSQQSIPSANAPAPGTVANFAGLDFANWGAAHPPDTNGDVGPNHYIQSINSSFGIFDKLGTPLARFTLDTLMSQGAFGNLCDTDNFGDPVVVYDSFEDRWVISDFAFQVNGAGDVV